ncbi:ATP-binding protein [Xanthomonas sp. WHRI 1810A]|uniref:sensor histidine kinase n=1 Tax=Xanthomonas sp. WHRI 1810A TaxID=3161565 RepID=UPI0032E8D529
MRLDPSLAPRLRRTTTFRLSVIYSGALLLGVVALVSLIYWQMSSYLMRQADGNLQGQVRALLYVEPDQLPGELDRLAMGDLRNVYYYGLFSATGQHLGGEVMKLPKGLPVNGKSYEWRAPGFQQGARALGQRLAQGQILFVGFDTKTLSHLRGILLNALLLSGTLIVLAGLALGTFLGYKPLRRVATLQVVSRRIAEGDLSQRLPLSRRGDELDMLSALVNQMMEEVQRLLENVKSVGDNVAHDLRTPLNTLRMQLHRTLEQWGQASADKQQARLEKALVATDVLLRRFRALQRIAEIDNQARSAGMAWFSPGELLGEMFEDYEAVAQEAGITLTLSQHPVAPLLGDREMLAEALMNLLDNALKFTPAGGRVALRLSGEGSATRIEVQDNGPGIAQAERESVLNRFCRGEQGQGIAGAGLGLAIVAAVARTHHCTLRLEDAEPGLRVVLEMARTL